jgi:hypothetical protein
MPEKGSVELAPEMKEQQERGGLRRKGRRESKKRAYLAICPLGFPDAGGII